MRAPTVLVVAGNRKEFRDHTVNRNPYDHDDFEYEGIRYVYIRDHLDMVGFKGVHVEFIGTWARRHDAAAMKNQAMYAEIGKEPLPSHKNVTQDLCDKPVPNHVKAARMSEILRNLIK
jgi:hypothetical protein